MRPLVHRSKYLGIELLQIDIDPATQQRRGTGQLSGQVHLPLFDRLAGSHGRRKTAMEKGAQRLTAGQSLFRQHAHTVENDVVIGAACAEPVKAERGIGFQLRRKRGDFQKHLVRLVTRMLLHALRDCGKPGLELPDFR
ncbi:hypothetical protein D3C87_1821520 [compost metagenome]